MTKAVITQTGRLQLKLMKVEDAQTVHYYRSIPEVSIFQGWTPASPKEVSDYAEKMQRLPLYSSGVWWQVIILNKQSQKVIGDLAFCIDAETEQQAELGVALDPAFQKQGYATEAIRAICDFLFDEKLLHRIHVSIDPRNTASLNLFARVGLRKEAHLVESLFFKGEWCDDIIMAVLAREWENLRTRN